MARVNSEINITTIERDEVRYNKAIENIIAKKDIVNVNLKYSLKTEDKQQSLIIIRINVADISVIGRSTQGVTLMRTNEGKVVSVEIIEPEETQE